MENKENRIVLTEDNFTHLCKVGFLKYQSPSIGRFDIQFYRHDIISLTKGEIVTKEIESEVFKFILQDIGIDNIREIVKRSPIYYEISSQIY